MSAISAPCLSFVVFLHYKEALMSKVSGKLVQHLSLTTLLWCRMAATEDVIASTKVEKLDCVERLRPVAWNKHSLH